MRATPRLFGSAYSFLLAAQGVLHAVIEARMPDLPDSCMVRI